MMELEGNILITGGAGFLGRAIIQAAHDYSWDCKISVYSRDEEKQWRLRHKYPEVSCILGDVRDSNRLRAALAGRDVVVHGAASKFVPESESAVMNTVQVNVDGTYNVATICAESGVGTAIFISTDKAVSAVNLYGMTKAVGEKMWSEMGLNSDRTAFGIARYGNVIGSTGSIIPLFKRQLATKGRISVTDPEMTRFFMTHEDAVYCILRAVQECQSTPGVIVGAKCEAMSIGALAGMVANQFDPDLTTSLIDIVGPRPGEKKHETLLPAHETSRAFMLPDGEAGRRWNVNDRNGLEHFAVLPSVAPVRKLVGQPAAEVAKFDVIPGTLNVRPSSPAEEWSSDQAPRIDPEAFAEAMLAADALQT